MNNVLELHDVCVHYLTDTSSVCACDNISLSLGRGKILGVVGESGSGKSTLLMAIARLQRPPAVITSGSILFTSRNGTALDLASATEAEIRPHRWTGFSVVFQSAMAAFNPVIRVGHQFTDVIRARCPELSAAATRQRTIERMALVGIGANRFTAYPHELSGGMRQRLMIALALACNPDLVIMDEPTTAVDVIMQRQIVAQILSLQRALGFAIIFVTHDLTLLLEFADDIAIMYAGRIVELGSARDIYYRPQHPYTKGLRDSFPPLRGEKSSLTGIGGNPPDLSHPLPGCQFAPRCSRKQDDCERLAPELELVQSSYCACWHRVPHNIAAEAAIHHD